MAFMERKDYRIHYERNGQPNSRKLIFSNSLGATTSMWDPQIPLLQKSFEILRYDTRGHGRSTATPGPYGIAQLGQDVLDLMDHWEIRQAHFCGLSMGGLTGMWLGLHASDRIAKLVLCSTAAHIGTSETWNARIAAVEAEGMQKIAAAVIPRWLTPEFRTKYPQMALQAQRMLENSPPKGYAACCAAVRDADFREEISGITRPTLVISGKHDPVTTPADGRFLAERIPKATYLELPSAHLSNFEAADEFSQAVADFLNLEGGVHG